MNFKIAADNAEQYIIEKRRFYHACPETSFNEKNTTVSLKKDLEEMGLEVNLFDGVYGLYSDIVGNKDGKTVALRADIDALKIDEATGLSFASTNGNMHACGHDTHIAMLLGAAKILSENKDKLNGTVRLIFQPAEEVAKGAALIIKQGVMNGVDAVYSGHIWGNFDAPGISIESGNRMAGSATVNITVTGLGAHASAPNLGVDAILAGSAVVMALQQYVSRINDPLNPLVLSIGTFHAGSNFNVIANEVKMSGSIRTFSNEMLDTAYATLSNIVESTAKAYGASATITVEKMTIPVINSNERLLSIAQNAVKKMYGEEYLTHLDTIMGSEDFSEYTQCCDGIFSFLGSRNREKNITYTNHHEQFDVDESVLKRGSALYAQFAFDFLNDN